MKSCIVYFILLSQYYMSYLVTNQPTKYKQKPPTIKYRVVSSYKMIHLQQFLIFSCVLTKLFKKLSMF